MVNPLFIQVAELKTQLATQEVELTRKNDEADKLIEIVGVETEKVSIEKANADEEELKVFQSFNIIIISYACCFVQHLMFRNAL